MFAPLGELPQNNLLTIQGFTASESFGREPVRARSKKQDGQNPITLGTPPPAPQCLGLLVTGDLHEDVKGIGCGQPPLLGSFHGRGDAELWGGGGGGATVGHAVQNLLKVTLGTQTPSNTALEVGTDIFLPLSKPHCGRSWRSREGKQRPYERWAGSAPVESTRTHTWRRSGIVWNSLAWERGANRTHANHLPAPAATTTAVGRVDVP